jgi:anti-sigma B factor antagonist
MPAEEAMLQTVVGKPLLHVELTGQPAGAVLRCVGEIDLSSVGCLERALSDSLKLPVPVVEVDLREVRFLDSSAVAALLQAHDSLRQSGRWLRVRVRPATARLLQLLHVDRVLPIEPE